MKQLILGSASLYKQALLRQAGFTFTVDPANVAEEQFIQATVSETVRVLAEVKAKALLPKYRGTDSVIITADVAGELHGKYIGKPASMEQARAWLQAYRGQKMFIWCGTTLTWTQPEHIITDVRCAAVQFNSLTPAAIETYLASAEPLDKGGALAIEVAQQMGWVEHITGEYAAIIGLSLEFIRQHIPQP